MKKRNTRGFTVAELLIVVAIIAILGGVGFVAVQNYQRDMAQLERDTIAKELFIAAQNHLTMAESQGYMGIDMTGNATSDSENMSDANKKVYYIRYDGGFSDVLEVMLPFGAIDETVRAGGRYIIRYQVNPGRVLDVFYWTTDRRYGGSVTLTKELYNNRADKNWRKEHYKPLIVGWYGGEEALSSGDYDIQAPTVEVVNGDRLYAVVTDNNARLAEGGSTAELKLLITSRREGAESQARVAFVLDPIQKHDRVTGPIDTKYTVILDDITGAKCHFADLNDELSGSTLSREGTFVPGEDIVVQAVAYSNSRLSNIAYSAEITVNSLFADVKQPVTANDAASDGEDDDINAASLGGGAMMLPDGTPVEDDSPDEDSEAASEGNTAMIANFRHLENLDAGISGVAHSDLNITRAAQIADLDWNGFRSAFNSDAPSSVSIYYGNTALSAGSYKPVDGSYLRGYDGGYAKSGGGTASHKITGIVTSVNANAGLFGSFGTDSTITLEDATETIVTSEISNLELIGFEITATGTANAGALAGTLTNVNVNNVEVRDYVEYDINGAVEKRVAVKISANGGTAGGLAGSMVGGSVTNALVYGAAAEVQSATGDAGGLVGIMSGGTVEKSAAAVIVSGSNAGGLIGTASGTVTVKASYSGGHTVDAAYSKEAYNVTGTDTAGGLIGDAGNTVIQYCYSTCSAKGATAGGFVGAADEATIEHCYATGLVSGTSAEGAFAGTLEETTVSGCQYYEVINERFTKEYPYLKALGDDGTNDEITPFDADADTYNTFVGKPDDWQMAAAYDKNALDRLFGENKFNLKTVQQLGGISDAAGLFVATHYGDWPAPEDLVVNQ